MRMRRASLNPGKMPRERHVKLTVIAMSVSVVTDSGGHMQYGRILAAAAVLLDADKAHGEIRVDIAPDEVFPLLSFLWHVGPQPEARIGHLLDLVIDALREPRP